MDFPFSPHDCSRLPLARGPVSLWLLAALVVTVIGAASIAAAFATEGDFVALTTVLKATAL